MSSRRLARVTSCVVVALLLPPPLPSDPPEVVRRPLLLRPAHHVPRRRVRAHDESNRPGRDRARDERQRHRLRGGNVATPMSGETDSFTREDAPQRPWAGECVCTLGARTPRSPFASVSISGAIVSAPPAAESCIRLCGRRSGDDRRRGFRTRRVGYHACPKGRPEVAETDAMGTRNFFLRACVVGETGVTRASSDTLLAKPALTPRPQAMRPAVRAAPLVGQRVIAAGPARQRRDVGGLCLDCALHEPFRVSC